MNDGPIMALGLLNILQLLFHKTCQPIDIFGFEKFNFKVKSYLEKCLVAHYQVRDICAEDLKRIKEISLASQLYSKVTS